MQSHSQLVDEILKKIEIHAVQDLPVASVSETASTRFDSGVEASSTQVFSVGEIASAHSNNDVVGNSNVSFSQVDDDDDGDDFREGIVEDEYFSPMQQDPSGISEGSQPIPGGLMPASSHARSRMTGAFDFCTGIFHLVRTSLHLNLIVQI